MAGRHTHTLDIGELDENGTPIETSMGSQKPQSGSDLMADLREGVELDFDTQGDGIDPARRLNPQRPSDPENLAEPTDFGLPPLVTNLTQDLSAMTERFQDFVSSNKRPVFAALLIVLVGLVVSVWFLKDTRFDVQPIEDSLLELSDQGISKQKAKPADNDSAKGEKTQQQANAPSKGPVATKVTEAGEDRILPDNPYWALPNRYALPQVQNRDLGARQRSDWEYRLNHRFTYQQYQAVREIRSQRIRGAAYLLVQALEKPKLWIRMNALFGLAEIGLRVDVDTVLRAIGSARSSLLANYLKRYLDFQPNGAELFVLRQMLRVVDASSRLVILKILANLRGDINDLYLVGANYDPSLQVQRWWDRTVRTSIFSRKTNERYDAIIKRYLEGESTPAPKEEAFENLTVEELQERELVNEVRFFQELIDSEQETIIAPDELDADGFEDLQE